MSKRVQVVLTEAISSLGKDGDIVDSGTPEDLIEKYGQKNLEEVFLEIVRKDK